MNHKVLKIYLGLALLMVFAFGLRYLGQPEIPQGFHRDEAAIGYGAYSIWQTGKDEWDETYPLYFKALGDYPPGGYYYLTSLLIPVLGVNELAVRMPAIIAGVLLIPMSWLFIKELFESEPLAWLVAGLVTIMPCDIVQSRASSEAIVALLFSLVGLLAYVGWTKQPKRYGYLVLMAVAYGWALFTYQAARLGLPLMQGLLTWYYWPDTKFKKQSIGLLAVLLAISFAIVFWTSSSATRFSEVSVFHRLTQETEFVVDYYREGSNRVPLMVSRILHNKPQNVIMGMFEQAAEFFSAEYLFFHGGFPARYRIPESGLIYPFLLIYLLLGIFYLLKRPVRQRWLVLLWLLLAILPAVITAEDNPHVRRTMYFYLPLYGLIGMGVLGVWEWLKRSWVKIGFVLVNLGVLAWSMANFGSQYAVHAKYETVQSRSYGYDQVFSLTEALKADYDKVVIFENNDTPHIFYLFYSQYPPVQYQQIADQNPGNLFRDDKQTWQIGNYEFDPGSCPEKIEEGVLYVGKTEACEDTYANVNVVNIVRSPDGLAKYVLYEFGEPQNRDLNLEVLNPRQKLLF